MNKSEKILSKIKEMATSAVSNPVTSPQKPDMSKVNPALKQTIGKTKTPDNVPDSVNLVPTPDSSPVSNTGWGVGLKDYETDTGDTNEDARRFSRYDPGKTIRGDGNKEIEGSTALSENSSVFYDSNPSSGGHFIERFGPNDSVESYRLTHENAKHLLTHLKKHVPEHDKSLKADIAKRR